MVSLLSTSADDDDSMFDVLPQVSPKDGAEARADVKGLMVELGLSANEIDRFDWQDQDDHDGFRGGFQGFVLEKVRKNRKELEEEVLELLGQVVRGKTCELSRCYQKVRVTKAVADRMALLQNLEFDQELKEAHQDRSRLQNIKQGIDGLTGIMIKLDVYRKLLDITAAIGEIQSGLLKKPLVQIWAQFTETEVLERAPSFRAMVLSTCETDENIDLTDQDCPGVLVRLANRVTSESSMMRFGGAILYLLLSLSTSLSIDRGVLSDCIKVARSFANRVNMTKTMRDAVLGLFLLDMPLFETIESETRTFAVDLLCSSQLSALFPMNPSLKQDNIDGFFVLTQLQRKEAITLAHDFILCTVEPLVPDSVEQANSIISVMLENAGWRDPTGWKEQWQYIMFAQRQFPYRRDLLQTIFQHIWSKCKHDRKQLSELLFKTPYTLEELSLLEAFLKAKILEDNTDIQLAYDMLITFYVLQNQTKKAEETHFQQRTQQQYKQPQDSERILNRQKMIEAQITHCIPPALAAHASRKEVALIGSFMSTVPRFQQPTVLRPSSSTAPMDTAENSKMDTSQMGSSLFAGKRDISTPLTDRKDMPRTKKTIDQETKTAINTPQQENASFFKAKKKPESATKAATKAVTSTPVYKAIHRRQRLPMPTAGTPLQNGVSPFASEKRHATKEMRYDVPSAKRGTPSRRSPGSPQHKSNEFTPVKFPTTTPQKPKTSSYKTLDIRR